jgi:hypothetical protein
MKGQLAVLLVVSVMASCAGSASKPASSFDAGDAGVYALVNRDGSLVANRQFRLSRTGAQWNLETKKEAEVWHAFTCEAKCQLVISTESDIRRIMQGPLPSDTSPACLHNAEFAFCRVVFPRGGKQYLFIALTTSPHVPIQVVRVAGIEGVAP